jgi:hypothetical protein
LSVGANKILRQSINTFGWAYIKNPVYGFIAQMANDNGSFVTGIRFRHQDLVGAGDALAQAASNAHGLLDDPVQLIG